LKKSQRKTSTETGEQIIQKTLQEGKSRQAYRDERGGEKDLKAEVL